MSSLEDKLRAQLNVRVRKSTIRKLTLPSAATDFSSNDFLGLAQSPLLRDQFLNLLNRHNSTHSFPLGSGGSRLLDGNSAFAEELESRIATFHRAPAALLCNSGFDANVSVFSSVPQAGDVVIHDELIHASCREGLRLSRATSTMSFLHNDVANLKAQIQAACADNQSLQSGQATLFVAVESVYSMDGDIAPLSSILDVMNQTLPLGNSKLVVDEAHATGVLGPLGAGIVARDSLEDKIFIRIHTFGKALAGNGAIILSSSLVRSYLINYARPIIYSTFMSFPSLALIHSAYTLLETGITAQLYPKLVALQTTLHRELLTIASDFDPIVRCVVDVNEAKTLLNTHPTPSQPVHHLSRSSVVLCVPSEMPTSPIVPLLTTRPRDLAAHCQRAGIMVRAVMSPTVPLGSERVRVCLNTKLTTDDILTLICALRQWLVGLGPPTPRSVL